MHLVNVAACVLSLAAFAGADRAYRVRTASPFNVLKRTKWVAEDGEELVMDATVGDGAIQVLVTFEHGIRERGFVDFFSSQGGWVLTLSHRTGKYSAVDEAITMDNSKVFTLDSSEHASMWRHNQHLADFSLTQGKAGAYSCHTDSEVEGGQSQDAQGHRLTSSDISFGADQGWLSGYTFNHGGHKALLHKVGSGIEEVTYVPTAEITGTYIGIDTKTTYPAITCKQPELHRIFCTAPDNSIHFVGSVVGTSLRVSFYGARYSGPATGVSHELNDNTFQSITFSNGFELSRKLDTESS